MYGINHSVSNHGRHSIGGMGMHCPLSQQAELTAYCQHVVFLHRGGATILRPCSFPPKKVPQCLGDKKEWCIFAA